MGDVFPDFDSMTPEEQMAWLESLAKRQGVKDEELTTKADMDIPVPENAQVDEPGYVPFEGSASARRLKEAQEAASVQAESEPPAVEKAEEPAWFEAETLEPVEAAEELEIFAEAGDAADSMLWLDNLAAQPEEEQGDLSDLFADVESVSLEEEIFEPEASETSLFEEPAAAEAQPAAASDDPLGGMDPMLWLESLAKRQGAKSDELMTSADLSVEEVPEGTAVDEPGYVPFEGSASARKMKEAAESIPEPVHEEPEPAEAEEAIEPEPAMFSESEALADTDSMRWLESLAKRQGADPEELMTQADLEIPELPADTIIDEPGYVEYSPFGILSPEQDLDLPEADRVSEELAEFGTEDEALSWLEDLAAEPGEDLSEILAFGEETFEPVAEQMEPPAPSLAEKAARGDPLAGMTDEEVAYAQAHGQLTGEQELAWLKRQAVKLAQARESQPEEMFLAEEVQEEIVPAELPPWLAQMRDEVDQGELEEAVPLAAESELPANWLDEMPAPEIELGMGEDTAELAEADVEMLWGEVPESEIELEEVALPDDSELAKFLAEGIVPEGADPLAEALDAEFERRLVGDETEPEWYTDAVAKVAAEAGDLEEEQAAEIPEEAVVEASLVDMPDWLKETEDEIKPALAGDEAVPDWLRETGEAQPAVEKQPEWFAEPEEVPAIAEEELPDWLRELDKPVVEVEETPVAFEAPEPVAKVEEPKPEPKLEPKPEVKAAPKPEPRVEPAKPAVEPEIRKPVPAKPVVRGELLEKITQRLKDDPNDHTTRLAFARALRDNQQLVPSLDQYEALIDTAQLLQDVSTDLSSLTEAHGDAPRVRRLLGDAYMRQGMLQEALNAYRGALEQL